MLRSGDRTQLCMHLLHDEIWFVLNGFALFLIDENISTVNQGHHIFVPRKTVHRISNNSEVNINLVCLSMTDKDWSFDKVNVKNYDDARNGSALGQLSGGGKVSLDGIDKNILAANVAQQVNTDPEFATSLVVAFNEINYDLRPRSPVVSDPLLGEITSDQMQGYREVSAARSRAYRAQLTPEQAAKESKAGAERGQASRAKMSPEKRAQRNAQEAERQRIKRAAAKVLQP